MSATAGSLQALLSATIAPHLSSGLHVAAASGHLDVAQVVLKAGAASNLGTPLQAAVSNGHESMVQLLLSAGACLECLDLFGNNPLLTAIKRARGNMLRLLLQAGASVTPLEPTGALTMACSSSREANRLMPGLCTAADCGWGRS